MIIEIILCRKKKKKMLGLLWHKISSHAHFKYEEAIDLRLGLVTWLIDISTLTLDLTGKIRDSIAFRLAVCRKHEGCHGYMLDSECAM